MTSQDIRVTQSQPPSSQSPAKALRAALLATLLATLLVTGCGYKTPLELPKRAPPAKSAS